MITKIRKIIITSKFTSIFAFEILKLEAQRFKDVLSGEELYFPDKECRLELYGRKVTFLNAFSAKLLMLCLNKLFLRRMIKNVLE